MAATPKPIRKYAKKLLKKSKSFSVLGKEGYGRKKTKAIAKVHASQALVSKKGKPHINKMKHGVWKGNL